MATPSRTAEREEERRHNLRTLAAASVGSASAALLTSRLWIAGTWIAAALTPVMVALVSELMNRPAQRIKQYTSERSALPKRAAPEPASEPAPMRVYRAGEAEPREPRGPVSRRRKIAYGTVFGTAALAFLIAVTFITVPELLAGGSVGKNDSTSTFFGGGKKSSGDSDKQTPQDTTRDEQAQPEEEQQQTTPEEEEPQPTTTTEEPPAEEAPPPDETAPPGEPLPQAAPPAEQP
jgi:hypothetical protein